LRWGIGHSTGVAIIGLLLLWLRGLVTADTASSYGSHISSWGERLVGVMLIAIGAWALRKAFRIHAHEHHHDHGGDHHIHLHSHSPRTTHEETAAHQHQHHTHAAVGIGILHGLAGSSHFFGVLPMLAFPDAAQRVGYLGGFAAGTIIAMATFSTVMGALASRFAASSDRWYRALLSTCATAAMLVGAFWVWRNF
jgi:putative Mn2+ efflux pump MntP